MTETSTQRTERLNKNRGNGVADKSHFGREQKSEPTLGRALSKPADDSTDPYPGLKGSDRVVVTCGKCGGNGEYNAPTSITWNGRGQGQEPLCLACGGTGTKSILVSSARANARAMERNRLEAEAAAETARAAHDLWIDAGYETLLERADSKLMDLNHGDPLRKKLDTARDRINNFTATPADAAAVTAALDAINERARTAVHVPEGRIDVEGVVVSTKFIPGDYMRANTTKGLIEGDGWKVYGNLPADIDEVQKGDRVAFKATVKKSDDDVSFGYFSRAINAKKL